jgi:streptothricin acetyltransferase
MHIVRESPESLEDYEKVSITFHIRSRMRLAEDGTLVEEPVEPRFKNYDAIPEERPTAHAHRPGLGIFAAFEGTTRIGGIIVGRELADLEITDGRSEVAVIIDLRVDPAFRGRGCGRHLFERALAWAHEEGCDLLRIETQDTNVAACRFYEGMGCILLTFEEGAYGPGVDEAKIYWERELRARSGAD